MLREKAGHKKGGATFMSLPRIEDFAVEKGKMRGVGTAPPGPK